VIFWQYFIANKKLWPHGFTKKRLEKLKPLCWNRVWQNALLRNAGRFLPDEMKKTDTHLYEHCFGNIAGMLCKEMHQRILIK